MNEKLSHVSIALRNIEKGLDLFSNIFGFEPAVGGIQKFPEDGVISLMLPIGDCGIELLQPIVSPDDPRGAVARFIEKRGEGLYHIALEVDDIEKELRVLTSKGVALIDQHPRNDLVKATGSLTAFLHPKSTGGILIELVQKV